MNCTSGELNLKRDPSERQEEQFEFDTKLFTFLQKKTNYLELQRKRNSLVFQEKKKEGIHQHR